MLKKCTLLWRESHFEVKMRKAPQLRSTFRNWAVQKVYAVVVVSRGKGFCTLPKVSKTWGFCRGTFEEDLARCIFRGRGSTRDTDLQFWEDDFAWQVQHFVWPGITFSWQAQHFRQMGWKNCKTHWYEAVSSALKCNSILEGSLAKLLRFWCCQLDKLRKSPKIALFLTLSSSKVEEVSQNCCVFDVLKFKNWGSLAE